MLRMRSYILRRIFLLIPVLFGVTIVIFALSMSFSPEQRAVLYARNVKQLQDLPALARKYNLYDPGYVQYINWLKNVLRGDLGWSYSSQMPVSHAILKYLPGTLELFLFSAPFIYLFGTRMGVISAVKKDTTTDHAIRTFAIIGWSLPTFWSAILLLSVFYGHLGWFPPGRLGTEASYFILDSANFNQYTGLNTIDALLNRELWIFFDALRHLMLPVLNLVIVSMALIMRVMRSSMLEALGKGYIMAAKAKGLDTKEVINKHAKKNAMIPVVTVSGLLFAGMISGLVITEVVFDYMGIGRWAAEATLSLDIAGILGFSLFIAVVFVLTNLIVDILYAVIDARIRLD
jgi:dipeptide transport system permease protein